MNGRITVDTIADGLTVPAIALRHGPRGDFVWVVKPDGTAATANVSVGQTANGRVLIERGLTKGERVVVDGYYRLDTGTKVEIDTSAKAAGSS